MLVAAMAALRDSFSLYSSTVVHVDCSPGFGGSEGGFRFVAFYSVIKILYRSLCPVKSGDDSPRRKEEREGRIHPPSASND